MRTYLNILTFLLLCIPCMAQQKNADKKLMVINGLLFHEKPEQKPTVLILHGSVKDSIWGHVTVMSYQNELNETSKQSAIPAEKIKNGKEILQKAKELRIARSRHIMGTALNVKAGDTFPEFSIYDDKGKLWSRNDFTGKKVVINFWYTGCGPCIGEMPELGTWVNQYPDVLFVAITFENAKEIQKIVEKKKFHFHQLVNARKLMKQIGVNSYPLTMVLDEQGKIIHLESGTSPIQRANILNALKK